MRSRPDAHYNAYSAEALEALEADFMAGQSALSPYACRVEEAVRRDPEPFHVARPDFVKDTERILNCRYFNRYADKTQVFSLYRNDDITRRIQHVQIVSRIGRSIGRMLRLNEDLIEAAALGHDLGHAPFGHLGERILSELLNKAHGIPFRHNVQSVRILDRILGFNLTVQTLDGILAHAGRAVRERYEPERLPDGPADQVFEALEMKKNLALKNRESAATVTAATLEGGVVRLADVLAYLGKDRQDARLLGVDVPYPFEENPVLGATNSEFIFNTVQNLVENSYGKPYLSLDADFADAIAAEKQANYDRIYARQNELESYEPVRRMFTRVYERCASDIEKMNEASPVFRHHVLKGVGGLPVNEERVHSYLGEPAAVIAADYIASMTDDYFMDLHEYLFPGAAELRYESYFGAAGQPHGAPFSGTGKEKA